VTEHLLERGASVSIPDGDGRTPLHLAAAAGRAQMIERLIALGADPNARDRDGCTPMYVSDAAGHALASATLRRHGGRRRPRRFLFFDLK
jgi:ankyrin repeat protein